jgi:hypothetical protein
MSFAAYAQSKPVVDVHKNDPYSSTVNPILDKGFSLSKSIIPSLIIALIVNVVISWLIFYTFNPNIVKRLDEGETTPDEKSPPDPMKCLVVSMFSGSIVTFFFWVSRRCI